MAPFVRTEDHRNLLLLLAFSLLLYMATTGYDFVVDDKLLLLQNPYVRSFHYLREIFTRAFWSFRGPEGQTVFYRPLVMLTLLLERALFGLRPAGFHLVNVILHALSVILVYQLAKRLWPEGKAALWAGLFFAALPVHTENVAPVSGISDLECAFFFLFALLVYTRAPDLQGRLPRWSAWAAAGLYSLAVLAKEVALVLPAILVFYEHFLRRNAQLSQRERFGRYAPTLLLTALYLVARFEILRGFAGYTMRRELGPKAVILSGFSLLGEYVYKLIWPHHLSYFETFHPPETWREPLVVFGGAVTLFSALTFARFWNRERTVCFAILWFFLTLGPVLNVHWLAGSAFGERYLYLPSVAFCWLLGVMLAGLSRISGSSRRGWGLEVVAPLALLALASARTVVRLSDWRNEFTLAMATLREAPDAAPHYVHLGNAYRAQGQRGLARQAYTNALALDPSMTEAYIDLAGVLMDDGAVDGARALLGRAVAVSPEFPEAYYAWGVIELSQGERARARQLFDRAVGLNPNYAEALNNLGVMLLEEGQVNQAQGLLERAVRSDPSYADAHNNLGSVYSRQNDPVRAEAEFRRALQLSPESELPYLNLAGLYEERGNPSAALEVYRTALRLRPNSANAHFRFGVLALNAGKVPEATRALERATEIQPRSSLAHTQLGLAYLAAGKQHEARRELVTAVRLDPDDETAKTALRKLD